MPVYSLFSFFFNDTATTEIYTLSLHDALPISTTERVELADWIMGQSFGGSDTRLMQADRKSTRLNSSHQIISYAVFCLKKKKEVEVLEPADAGSLVHGIDTSGLIR